LAVGSDSKNISLSDDNFTQAKRIIGNGDIPMVTVDSLKLDGVDIIKIDFPEFFNQEYTMLQADLLRYLKENVEFSCEPIEHNQGWEITYRDEDGCYLSTYNKNQSLTFKTLLA